MFLIGLSIFAIVFGVIFLVGEYRDQAKYKARLKAALEFRIPDAHEMLMRKYECSTPMNELKQIEKETWR